MKKMVLFLLSILLFGVRFPVVMGEGYSVDQEVVEEVFEDSDFDEDFDYDEFDYDLEEEPENTVEEVEPEVKPETTEPEAAAEEVAEEVAEEPAKPEEMIDPSPSMSQKMMWQFIEDELLLGPGYLSAFMTPLKGLGAAGALSLLIQDNASSEGLSPRGCVKDAVKTISERAANSPFVQKTLLAIWAVAGYKLTKWTIECIIYSFFLKSFLYDYPRINRSKTPEQLRPYLDKEYDAFIMGNASYLMKRSKKVLNFVRMAVKMHKKGVAF
ncbi:hypothetical protein KKA53_01830 [Candidatus Dependentiae bacterium]|nr:hypothetical protein [Candidatus Dependentiae bacterium]